MSQAWNQLHDGQSVKIYFNGERPYPWTVAHPDGFVHTVTSTRWGARRVARRLVKTIRKERAELEASRRRPRWWESPRVERFDV